VPCPEVKVQRNHVQLAAQFASCRLVDRGAEQLAEVEELLAKLHLNGKAVGVLQDPVGEAQFFGYSAVVVKVQWAAFAGKVIEYTFGLPFPDPLFHQSIEESHERNFNRLCGDGGICKQ